MIVAVLDACVLYPPSVRDLLMWVATTGAYSPRWTDVIQAEWVSSVLADNPAVSQVQLERTCRLMEQAIPEGSVKGYEIHIPTLALPDPADLHVLAAAIHASASHIVTYNLSDFPDSALGLYDLEAIHPDLFLSALLDDKPALFLRGVRVHRSSLRHPPKDVQQYIDTMTTNGLFELARRLGVEYRDAI